MKIVEIQFDGGYGEGVATFGYIVTINSQKFIGAGKHEDARMTSNIAEYLGLLKAIQRFKKEVKNPELYEVMIYGDSRLVIETVGKRWGWSKAKHVWNPHKKEPELLAMLQKILKELKGINFQTSWVRRNKNTEADSLTHIHRK